MLIGEQAWSVAIPPHDTDGPHGLSLGSRDYVMPFEDVSEDCPSEGAGGLGLTVPGKGRQGVPSLSRSWTSL